MGGSGSKEMACHKILLIGLSGSGKTTLLYQLKLQQVVIAVPSIAFNVEKIQHADCIFEIFDVGGNLKSTWIHHYEATDAIAFVMDATNRTNLKDIKFELDLMFKDKTLDGVPLLLIANKQDQSNPMKSEEIIRELQLNDIKDRDWHVQPCTAIQTVSEGGGLHDALVYLSDIVEKKKKADKKKKKVKKTSK
ncbi:ADP-ribosylation factor-related protein [Tieghemostelium lacteum]|uniref:ADP-ribosylation factor-related protein n=1 Tax=Tieghemostelium lacteum TaxID=361077 RepID=A0A152A943_TIELA|nr:ADP-ribosylation factor-related protein [Tieghemostelium lacteum]|eukprot:KYR02740.1 ADP-ribosylation factor-related protein [Tieghemostelium lacteum]